MGEAAFDDEIAFLDQSLRAAAVLCRTEHGNLHAGVMYRNGDEAAVLHLGWQDYLSQDWTWTRLWAAPDVEPERLVSVAGLCRRIWRTYEQNRTFPYAIRFAGTSFSTDGQLVLGEGARGLTCATFILAVFKAMGIELVDEMDWPIREEADQVFLNTISSFATAEHLALLQAEIDEGCNRIHPDEVLGACAGPPPAKFASAREVADHIVERLDSLSR